VIGVRAKWTGDGVCVCVCGGGGVRGLFAACREAACTRWGAGDPREFPFAHGGDAREHSPKLHQVARV
jgi:hypothetical protein